jgi:hypothetical protein
MIKKKVPRSEGHIFFMRYDTNRPLSLSRNGFKVSLIIIINILLESLSISKFFISLWR